MIGRICGALCAVCALYAICSGSTAAFSAALLDGIARAVQLAITLGGAMCFWGGILEAAQSAGILKTMCRILHPLFSFLFPESRKNPQVAKALCASFCANLIGLGNAATPLGIAAMRAMAAQEARGWASDDMILFAVLNTTALSLLPTNLLSLRRAAGSADPFSILAPIWLCSALGCVFAIFLCRLFARLCRKSKKSAAARRVEAATPAKER